MRDLKISVIMPVYNGSPVIYEAIESVLNQDYQKFDIIISDDGSTDDTEEIVRGFRDRRIKYFKNKKNLGYGRNLEHAKNLSSAESDIIFLMAQDDLLRKGTLRKVNEIFKKYQDVGAITRPFYMFTNDLHKPIRDFPPYNRGRDTVLTIQSGEEAFEAIFRTVCQLSGLAFRKSIMKVPFNKDVMTSHVYPFLDIFKRYKIVFLKDYTVAVRTMTSMTRTQPKSYAVSPTQSWVNLVHASFPEREMKNARKICLKIVLQNYVGLVQLKNFSTYKVLVREYGVFVKKRWINLFNVRFLFYVLVTFFTPRGLLLPFVDFYKENILSFFIKPRKIHFVRA